ncbi:MAG TPA: class I SAM-dependent methyltransferase [Patescibacteria group bacterium]|nr:class I SAM-dependent methyltransferase [Patescibacteria group bacterium]
MDSQKAQNSSSLDTRININNQYSKNNLNDWIFSLLSLKIDSNILDLCCGRGNQSFKFAEICNQGTVYTLDMSEGSLSEIDSKEIKNIKTIQMNIDFLSNAPFKENYFDVIHCAYGLYYAKDATKIIAKAVKLLKQDGILIVVGPTDDNNRELFDFIDQLYPIDKDIIFMSRDFMNSLVVPTAEKFFSKVNKNYFNNEVTYPTVESLYSYFKSSTMFKEEYDQKIKAIIDNHFLSNDKFVITKKAMGMVAKK